MYMHVCVFMGSHKGPEGLAVRKSENLQSDIKERDKYKSNNNPL